MVLQVSPVKNVDQITISLLPRAVSDGRASLLEVPEVAAYNCDKEYYKSPFFSLKKAGCFKNKNQMEMYTYPYP